MKKKTIIIAIVAMLTLGFLMFKSTPQNNTLASPNFDLSHPLSPTPTPTPEPPSPPKQFKFDGSTDLKKELDSIDPKVQDSDF